MRGETRIDHLTMFHFRCPLCGGEPDEVALIDYLSIWQLRGASDLSRLMELVWVATSQIQSGNSRWLTKKFRNAADTLLSALTRCTEAPILENHGFLTRHDHRYLHCAVWCPVCKSGPGQRRADSWFTTWNEACKVQTGNLYYEIGLIVAALESSPNAWTARVMLKEVADLRKALLAAGVSTGLPTCSVCGRFTNTLYGATNDQPERGRCRWCIDSGVFPQIRL